MGVNTFPGWPITGAGNKINFATYIKTEFLLLQLKKFVCLLGGRMLSEEVVASFPFLFSPMSVSLFPHLSVHYGNIESVTSLCFETISFIAFFRHTLSHLNEIVTFFI